MLLLLTGVCDVVLVDRVTGGVVRTSVGGRGGGAASAGHDPRAASHPRSAGRRARLAHLATKPRKQQPERSSETYHHQIIVHYSSCLP